MDPSLLSLEALQKEVSSGAVTIPVACFKLQGIIHDVVKDDSRQFFRQLFPLLLNFIIGSRTSPGLLEMVKDKDGSREVFHLLHPCGNLYLSMLHMQTIDTMAKFEVLLPEAETPVGAEPKAKLDYVEYFYYHLIKVVSAMLPSIPTAERSRPARPMVEVYRRFVSLGIGIPHVMDERSCRWNHDLVAETYLGILEAHLEYVLPTNANITKENVFTNPDYKSKAMAAGHVSYALVGLVAQFWLAVDKDVTKCPSLDVLHALELVVRHTTRSMCESPSPNRYVGQAIDTAFTVVRTALYPFFKSLISRWPLDYHFIAMVSVWQSFVSPWTHLSLDRDPEYWHPYVLNNLLFYTTIYNLILEHIEASLEALISVQQRSKLVHLQGHEYAKRLLPVVDALKSCLSAVAPVTEVIQHVEFSSDATFDRLLHEQLATLEPTARSMPRAFDSASVNRAMNLIRWLVRAHKCLQNTSMSDSTEWSLDGMLIECQDEIHHLYAINDDEYSLFVERKDAEERAEAESRLTPRRRNLIPATPETKQQILHNLRPSSGRPFCNDEIPILVTFFVWLSRHINRNIRSALLYLHRNGVLPDSFVQGFPDLDLRCFAIKQNLVFTGLLFVLLYILVKLFR